ncbi:hypothetical protein L596_006193 [Steinernema carpocapsae]|uniref:Uncharacterized protein n=1 Tax=Steinernema carpocapsae TaxID=34508 RepID=A0A4U8V1D3_STECR|nr:hypothetical protein L596_006193 [Steinernema carpocapsae]
MKLYIKKHIFTRKHGFVTTFFAFFDGQMRSFLRVRRTTANLFCLKSECEMAQTKSQTTKHKEKRQTTARKEKKEAQAAATVSSGHKNVVQKSREARVLCNHTMERTIVNVIDAVPSATVSDRAECTNCLL